MYEDKLVRWAQYVWVSNYKNFLVWGIDSCHEQCGSKININFKNIILGYFGSDDKGIPVNGVILFGRKYIWPQIKICIILENLNWIILLKKKVIQVPIY